MNKLLFRTPESAENKLDDEIKRIANDAELCIASPYITLDYFKKIIEKAKSWFLLTDLDALIKSTSDDLDTLFEFLEQNKNRIGHIDNLHAKVIYANKDGKKSAILGSANFTQSGVFKNIEVSMFTDDVSFTQELFIDWYKKCEFESTKLDNFDTSKLFSDLKEKYQEWLEYPTEPKFDLNQYIIEDVEGESQEVSKEITNYNETYYENDELDENPINDKDFYYSLVSKQNFIEYLKNKGFEESDIFDKEIYTKETFNPKAGDIYVHKTGESKIIYRIICANEKDYISYRISYIVYDNANDEYVGKSNFIEKTIANNFGYIKINNFKIINEIISYSQLRFRKTWFKNFSYNSFYNDCKDNRLDDGK